MPTTYKYEVALSFAGEQRNIAEAIGRGLENHGISVFYDFNEKGFLWGKNLNDHLMDLYQNQARFCIIIASKEYAQKMWTTVERQAAQARALLEKGTEYILPVRYDETDIPGIPRTVGYLNYSKEGVGGICEAFLQKLRGQSLSNHGSASMENREVTDNEEAESHPNVLLAFVRRLQYSRPVRITIIITIITVIIISMLPYLSPHKSVNQSGVVNVNDVQTKGDIKIVVPAPQSAPSLSKDQSAAPKKDTEPRSRK